MIIYAASSSDTKNATSIFDGNFLLIYHNFWLSFNAQTFCNWILVSLIFTTLYIWTGCLLFLLNSLILQHGMLQKLVTFRPNFKMFNFCVLLSVCLYLLVSFRSQIFVLHLFLNLGIYFTWIFILLWAKVWPQGEERQ